MTRLPSALLLSGVLLLSACGSESSDSTIPTTTTTEAPAADAVLDSYRAFWGDYLAVTNPMTPGNPRIAAHATGAELTALNGIVVAGHAKGSIYKGTFELHPSIQSSTENSAFIKDCYIDKTGEYNAKTDERLDKEDLTPRNITATLTLVDGTWKVSAIDHKSEPCSP
jgi:hypothetical protein